MSKFILLLLLLVAASLNAHQPDADARICAPFRNGIVDPAIVNTMLDAAREGRLYRISPSNSEIGFCVESAIGRIEAHFHDIQGGMALSQEIWGDRSQVLVMVDARSLALESAFVRKMLHSEAFLDTETYATILFVSTRLEWLDDRHALLRGLLTLHGVTRPVVFRISMDMYPGDDNGSVGEIIVIAKAFIQRGDFDMDRLTYIVHDTVELCMRITASLFRINANEMNR